MFAPRSSRARSRSSRARRARRSRSAHRVQLRAQSLRPPRPLSSSTVVAGLCPPDSRPPPLSSVDRQVRIAHTLAQEVTARLGRDHREARLCQSDLRRAWELLESWWPQEGSPELLLWTAALEAMDVMFETVALRLSRLDRDLALSRQDLGRVLELIPHHH